jgi:hypothetical protein
MQSVISAVIGNLIKVSPNLKGLGNKGSAKGGDRLRKRSRGEDSRKKMQVYKILLKFNLSKKEGMVMAILLTRYSCPTEHMAEMTKRVQEIRPKFEPPPDYAKIIGPYWNPDIEGGINCFQITEVEPSKILDERLRIAAFCNALHGIPGLTWSVELWVEQADNQARIQKYGS